MGYPKVIIKISNNCAMKTASVKS